MLLLNQSNLKVRRKTEKYVEIHLNFWICNRLPLLGVFDLSFFFQLSSTGENFEFMPSIRFGLMKRLRKIHYNTFRVSLMQPAPWAMSRYGYRFITQLNLLESNQDFIGWMLYIIASITIVEFLWWGSKDFSKDFKCESFCRNFECWIELF